VLKLIIEDDEGRKTVVRFSRDEITIGRQEGNTIRLTERNVSRRHARLFRQNGSILVEDLGSYNGVRVNGERVVGHAPIHDGDLIEIGDYDLELEGAGRVAMEHISPTDLTPPHGVQLPTDGEGATVALDQAAIDAAAESSSRAAKAETAREEPAEAAEAEPNVRAEPTVAVSGDGVESSRKRPVREISAAEGPRLVALNTDLAGREFKCLRTEVRIGRTSENDICLDHRSLSRTHAKLVREDSGEWRIIDLRSANGLLVNGERYAESSLSHLDTVELGHLKLKFVAAGEPFSLIPGVAEAPRSGKSKLPVLLGGGAALLLAGAVAAFFALSSRVGEPTARRPSPAEEGAIPSAPVAAAPDVGAAAEPKQPPQAAPDETRPVELKQSPQAVPGESKPVDEASAELLLKAHLDRAAEAIDDGKLDEAKRFLEQAVATVAFQDQYKQLSTRLADARRERNDAPKRERKKTASKPGPTPPRADEAKPATPSPADEAKKLYDEGLALFTRKQNREAREVFKRCLAADSTFARCHLLAGSASARLGEPAAGAQHYETFLRLAPTAPEAHKVRAFLDDYHQSKQRDSN
jgi:pSer/pThr/pTyr-binding forkhead associated (FHA) protein/tetratricopeptide (TPR) repeat protein